MIRNQSPKSVLVTGAAGFIGRYLLEALRLYHPEIRLAALDRFPIHEPFMDTFCLELSLNNRDRLIKIFKNCKVDAVIHCAGSSRLDRESLRRDNEESFLSLIETLLEYKTGLIFCYIGSSAEYQPLPKPLKTAEDTPNEPVGEYGKIKLAVSRMVLELTRRREIQGYVLRLFNPLGPGMSEDQLIGRLWRLLRKGPIETISVGKLDSYRDYCDVRDVVRGIASSLFVTDRLIGRVINLGSGHARSTREVVMALLQYLSWPVNLKESEEHDSERSSAVLWQEADISLARKLLEWSPRIPFSETIAHIADSIPFHPDGPIRR